MPIKKIIGGLKKAYSSKPIKYKAKPKARTVQIIAKPSKPRKMKQTYKIPKTPKHSGRGWGY